LPDESEDDRIRRGALTIAAGVICVLTPIWVITYLTLDLPLSAAILLAYLIISVASLVILWRTKRLRAFRALQLALMLALPFDTGARPAPVTKAALERRSGSCRWSWESWSSATTR
jgi:hypothetical protein